MYNGHRNVSEKSAVTHSFAFFVTDEKNASSDASFRTSITYKTVDDITAALRRNSNILYIVAVKSNSRAGFNWWEAWGPVYLGRTERLQQLYD